MTHCPRPLAAKFKFIELIISQIQPVFKHPATALPRLWRGATFPSVQVYRTDYITDTTLWVRRVRTVREAGSYGGAGRHAGRSLQNSQFFAEQMLFCVAMVRRVSPNCVRETPGSDSSSWLNWHAGQLAKAVMDAVSSQAFMVLPSAPYYAVIYSIGDAAKNTHRVYT